MKKAMPQAETDAVGVEVGGGVVAEEFGVTEDEAGSVAVVGVPGYQGKDGGEKGEGPVSVGSLGFFIFIAEPED